MQLGGRASASREAEAGAERIEGAGTGRALLSIVPRPAEDLATMRRVRLGRLRARVLRDRRQSHARRQLRAGDRSAQSGLQREESTRVARLAPRYPRFRRFDVELIGVEGRYGRQLWVRCVLRTRKVCLNCWTYIEPKQRGYRPITNGQNRMDRLCVHCIEWKPVEGAVEAEARAIEMIEWGGGR